ncbi:MAG: hypothetical protein FWF08_07100 [Oscillospiraceae bacterium]|nr:hypothetical protein [Oscillospiraceae bacterium]
MDFKESEMEFGNFDESKCFRIEKSDIYKKNFGGNGFSTVEFVLFRPEKNKLLFVEAKTTLPDISNKEDFNKNVDGIVKKFVDSFYLTLSLWFENNNYDKRELPLNYIDFINKNVEFTMVLVIKNRKADGIKRIKARITERFPKRELRLWKFDVIVMNEDFARKNNLVVSKNT